MARHARTPDFSKALVTAIILTVLIYTAVVLIWSWHGKIVPAELTVSFYGFFGFETGWLAYIKVNKMKSETEIIYRHKEEIDRGGGYSTMDDSDKKE